jgi:hypothetical protein
MQISCAMAYAMLDTYKYFRTVNRIYIELTRNENNFTQQNLPQIFNMLPNTKQVIVAAVLYDCILKYLFRISA